jgi:hypothetical protein
LHLNENILALDKKIESINEKRDSKIVAPTRGIEIRIEYSVNHGAYNCVKFPSMIDPKDSRPLLFV